MNLGFLTNCLNGNLTQKIALAKALGFHSLEITVGDSKADIFLDTCSKSDRYLLKQTLQEAGISISSLAYYQNLLTHDLALRKKHLKHLKHVIQLADDLGVHCVSTFLGRDASLSIKENFHLLKTHIQPLVAFAESLAINIAIENCPMPTWDKNGFPSTISYTPELWQEMFRVIPNSNFGLNFDASHLIWQQIDYLGALEDYFDRIFNVHLKDVTVETENLKRYGIFGKQIERQHPYDFGWYQPILLGEGDIDWPQILNILQAKGFEGHLTIEFKDDRFKTQTDILKGLIRSKTYMETIERKLCL